MTPRRRRRSGAHRAANPTQFAVDALAAYRLTRLLISDGIFDEARREVRGRLQERGNTKLLELIECPWCLGMWIAGGVVLTRRVAPALWSPVATTLALSATSGIIASLVREADDQHRVVQQVLDDDAPNVEPVVSVGARVSGARS